MARHHRHLYLCAGAVLACTPICPPGMRPCATLRASISVSRCRSLPHVGAASVVAAVTKSKGDLGLVPAFVLHRAPARLVECARIRYGAEDHRPTALRRARRSSCRAACVRRLSRGAAEAMVREVEAWSVRVAGWNAATAREVGSRAEVIAVPDNALDGAALLISVPLGGSIEAVIEHAARYRRFGALPRRSWAATRPAIELRMAGRCEAAAHSREPKMSGLQRPQPRAGVLDIEPYVPGKSAAPGVPGCSSSHPMRRRLARARTPSPPIARSPATCRSIPTARQPRCARRSAALSGSIPAASSAAPGRTICSIFLRDAYLTDGDEAIHTTHGFLVYPIATRGSGATPLWRRRSNTPPTSMRSSQR